jgi:hypothetical protein
MNPGRGKEGGEAVEELQGGGPERGGFMETEVAGWVSGLVI